MRHVRARRDVGGTCTRDVHVADGGDRHGQRLRDVLRRRGQPDPRDRRCRTEQRRRGQGLRRRLDQLDEADDGALQGGATFELCRTHTYDIDHQPVRGSSPDDCITTSWTTSMAIRDSGTTRIATRASSWCRVSARAVHGAGDRGPAGVRARPDKAETVERPRARGHRIVDHRPVRQQPAYPQDHRVRLRERGHGETAHGVTAGTVTYTVNLKNYGTADAELTDSVLVVSGNATCDPRTTRSIFRARRSREASGTAGKPFTLTCTYRRPRSGRRITATLTVNYTTNGTERAASGSPAVITFTVTQRTTRQKREVSHRCEGATQRVAPSHFATREPALESGGLGDDVTVTIAFAAGRAVGSPSSSPCSRADPAAARDRLGHPLGRWRFCARVLVHRGRHRGGRRASRRHVRGTRTCRRQNSKDIQGREPGPARDNRSRGWNSARAVLGYEMPKHGWTSSNAYAGKPTYNTADDD